ncbi:MAG: phytanoyl-CoA dioxygenase family protein, partial [Casimicrobium sp.]
RLQRRISALRMLKPIQCTLFEKSAERNWSVTAHQDLMLPTEQLVGRQTADGLCVRRGSCGELANVVAVRCHVDDCLEGDGALRTKPGTHRLGILRDDQVVEKTKAIGWKTHEARSGDVLLMRPLVVHSSAKSSGVSRRRVLHFVFA